MDRVIALGATEYFFFTTRDFDTGAPQTLGGSPVVSAYEDNGTTEITAGVSVSADFDTRTGLNVATVTATSGNGFEAGKLYNLVITTGTVDTVSVAGEVVATFRVETAAENAIREANEATFLADTPTAFTGNTTTAINLTGIVDSSALDDHVINEIFLVKYEGGTYDGLALLVVATDYTASPNQLAAVEVIGTEGALPEAVASGDKVIRVGGHATVSNIIADEDGAGLTEAGGTGDHLTALPTDADLMPVANEAFTYQFHLIDSNGDPATGITVTANRIIDGAAVAAATGTVTEVSNGVYEFAASAADMNGAAISHIFSGSGAITAFAHFITTSGV